MRTVMSCELKLLRLRLPQSAERRLTSSSELERTAQSSSCVIEVMRTFTTQPRALPTETHVAKSTNDG